VVLLLHVAVAVDRASALTPELFAILASPGPFEPGVIYRVCSELSMASEHLLVLDDVHLVRGSFSCDAIAALALHVGPGSEIVLSGRGSEGLPIARLRAAHGLLEIGAVDLALDEAETGAVLAHAGVRGSPDDASLLAGRTEGWAIGVYLAALSLGSRTTMSDTLAALPVRIDTSSITSGLSSWRVSRPWMFVF
jgi:LuxR family maltose regulon positive regulatory protein